MGLYQLTTGQNLAEEKPRCATENPRPHARGTMGSCRLLLELAS